MAKANRATRKELEEVIKGIIGELEYLRQGFTAIDNYLGAYVKYKGDTLMFSEFLQKEIEKAQEKAKTATNKPKSKDVKSDKKSRYSKVGTPPL